jgi:hypothetical protein
MALNRRVIQKRSSHAHSIDAHRPKRQAVTTALPDDVQRREQMKIFRLAGTIEYDASYDAAKQRRSNSGATRKRGTRR